MPPSHDDFDFSQWMYQTACGLITESVLYGIYVSLVTLTLRHLWFAHDNRTNARLMTLFSLLLMFAMSTTLWILDTTKLLRGITEVIIDTDETAHQRATDFQAELNNTSIIQTTIFTVEYLIGDTVVAWRACALWQYNKKIMFLPILLLSSATVLIWFFLGCLGVNNWAFLEGEAEVCYGTYLGVFFLSIATNVVATTLIAVKAWRHHRLLLRTSVGSRSRVMKILILMVESGLIYLLIWATKSMGAFGTLKSGGAQFTVSILNMIGNQIVGLYPTLLVVLVRMQQTTLNADMESYNNWDKTKDKWRRTEEGMIFASPTETLAGGNTTTSGQWSTNLTLLGSAPSEDSTIASPSPTLHPEVRGRTGSY